MFLQGLETHRNIGYPYGIAIALDNVGTAYYYSHMAVGMNLKNLHVAEEMGKDMDLATVINEIL